MTKYFAKPGNPFTVLTNLLLINVNCLPLPANDSQKK